MLSYFKTAFNATITDKSIPSLDGLRAISAFLVVISHIYFQNFSGTDTRYFIFQDVGVSLFFVISGFLITSLLIKEVTKNGFINYKRFAAKRLFRIFPAFYFYISFWLISAPILNIDIPAKDFLACYFYLGHYFSPNMHILIGQSWSLAIEEQFYLFWPICLKILKDRKKIMILICILIILSPFMRVGTYFFSEIYKYKYQFLLHGRIDALMFGCWLAFATEYKSFEKIRKFLGNKKVFLGALIYLFLIYPVLTQIFLGKFRAPFGYSLEGICLLSVIIHLKEKQNNWYYNFLNSAPLKHLGSISYGIYLWQQPFTTLKYGIFFKLPLSLVAIYLSAMGSYLLIEYPFMQLRGKLLQLNSKED